MTKAMQVRGTRSKGFSLMELLITLVIMGIFLALAVPMFTEFLDRQAIRAVCSELVLSHNAARNDAIRRSAALSQMVYVGPRCSQSMNDGWVVFYDSNNDQCYNDGEVLVQQSSPLTRNVRITSALTQAGTDVAAQWVGYNGQGFTRTPTGSFIGGTFTCAVDGRPAQNAVLTLNSTGRIRSAGL